MNKISILGAGKVGKAVALSLFHVPMKDLDLVLYNRTQEHVEAFVKDVSPIA